MLYCKQAGRPPTYHTGAQSMIIFDYPSKKTLKENLGQPLRYIETSIFGAEYVADGFLTGANRPHITGHKREFFARVRMVDGLISKVE